MKRSPLQRKTPLKAKSGLKSRTQLKATKRVNPVSDRRRERDSVYADAREQVFQRAGGRCEGMVSAGCTFRCEQVHHKAGRNVPDPHALSNLIGLCEPCHRWAHANPAAARRAGVSVSRLAA